MNAEELRIGNLIAVGVNTVQVRSIHKDTLLENKPPHIYVDGYANFKSYCFEMSEVKPIDLSSEWLERFGFKRQNNAWNDPKENNTDFSIWNPPGDEVYSLNDTIFIPEIKHIHQLQNLYFSLTGKEIKLTKV